MNTISVIIDVVLHKISPDDAEQLAMSLADMIHSRFVGSETVVAVNMRQMSEVAV